MKTRFFVFFIAMCTEVGATFGPGVHLVTQPVDHTETPTWDSRNNRLYFVNLYAGQIYRYDYVRRSIRYINLGGTVAPVIPSKRDPNLLIVGWNRSVVAVEWIGDNPPSATRILTTVSDQFPASRFNDGKADKQGRLLIGTVGDQAPDGSVAPNQGVLYEVTCETLSSPTVLIAPVNISNGAAWNRANDKYYYIDTSSGQVVEYAYDNGNGKLSNRRVVFDIADHKNLTGTPDGMTIDKDDNLWVALYGGGAVIKISSATGRLLQVVAIPAENVTSATWGGPALDILFVTTSRYLLTEEQRKKSSAAGGVFAVSKLGTRGVPAFPVNLLRSINDVTCGARKTA